MSPSHIWCTFVQAPKLKIGTQHVVSNSTLVVTDGQTLSSVIRFIVVSAGQATAKTSPLLHTIHISY